MPQRQLRRWNSKNKLSVICRIKLHSIVDSIVGKRNHRSTAWMFKRSVFCRTKHLSVRVAGQRVVQSRELVISFFAGGRIRDRQNILLQARKRDVPGYETYELRAGRTRESVTGRTLLHRSNGGDGGLIRRSEKDDSLSRVPGILLELDRRWCRHLERRLWNYFDGWRLDDRCLDAWSLDDLWLDGQLRLQHDGRLHACLHRISQKCSFRLCAWKIITHFRVPIYIVRNPCSLLCFWFASTALFL